MILYGINPILEAMNSKYKELITQIMIDKDSDNKRLKLIVKTAQQLGIKVRTLNKNVISNITKTSSHQGVAFEVERILYRNIDEVVKDVSRIILCDSIQDANNLGAIMRNSVLFDFNTVVITKDRSIDITPSVVKTSSGSFFHIDVVKVVNLARTIEYLRDNGYYIVGLDANAENDISKLKVRYRVGVVVGAEGEGIRELVKKKCDILCHIKTTKKIDSLNVSVATAIAMYEIFKNSVSR